MAVSAQATEWAPVLALVPVLESALVRAWEQGLESAWDPVWARVLVPAQETASVQGPARATGMVPANRPRFRRNSPG